MDCLDEIEMKTMAMAQVADELHKIHRITARLDRMEPGTYDDLNYLTQQALREASDIVGALTRRLEERLHDVEDAPRPDRPNTDDWMREVL